EQLYKIDVGASDWLLTLGSIALLFTPAAPFATAVLIFEGLFVAIRAIGYGASDALEAVDLFSDDISETTKSKVAPFVEQMRGLEDVMKSIEWTGTIIDDALVEDVKVKTAAIRDTIVNELDSDKNEALATLEPLKAALSAEAYAKLVADNKAYYEGMVTQITDSEAEINSIMATAKAENRTLTQEEANKINEIQANMKDNGVLHLSETEEEYRTIMRRMADNSERVSLEQASEIIKNAKKTRDEAISSAHTQYTKVEMEAERMYDVGAINYEQYADIMEAAEKTKDKAIDDANTQYSTIEETAKTKLGETAKFIDSESGEIRSKWSVFCTDFADNWTTGWNLIKQTASDKLKEIEEWFNTTVKPLFTKDFWVAKFKGIADGFKEICKNAINSGITLFNTFISWINEKMKFSWDGIKIAGRTIVNAGSIQLFTIPDIPMFAMGGFPEDGLFMANHNELVGSFSNGRTAVANNDQITSGIEQAVYRAMMSVMSQQQERPILVNANVAVDLDGQVVGRSVDAYNQNKGYPISHGVFANAY
ncbi:MAG: hypothetical protein RSC38_01860, partial [Oscillospiraceae bacterium]